MERLPLQNGTTLQLLETGSQNSYTYLIGHEIGRGASCIVYEGCRADSPRHKVRIKECYPEQDAPQRIRTELQWPDEARKNNALERFEQGYNTQLFLQSEENTGNAAVHTPLRLCRANGTLYAVLEPDYGKTLDCCRPSNLQDMLTIARALTRVVKSCHENGYLHLDIKPENVLVLDDTPDMVKLLDVDSLIVKKDFQQGTVTTVSCSRRWAAPELRDGRFSLVDERSDLYSIGAVLLWMVMGREVSCDDRSLSAQWKFDEPLFSRLHPGVKRCLSQIFHRTLCSAPAYRCKTASELLILLQQALELVRQGKAYLISNVEQVARFVGRRQELEALCADFTGGKKVVFLSGLGGMGKSTLAKQYAQANCGPQALYDTVMFCRYRDNTPLKQLIAGLPMSRDDTKNRFNARRSAMDEHTLLILDNYDVASPGEDWEMLTSLPCHLLVTTRTDFSHWTGDGPVAQHRIDTLEASDLQQLFEQTAGIRIMPPQLPVLQKIFRAIGGHTLLTELLAKQLRESHLSLEQLQKNLFDQPEPVYYQKDGCTREDTIRQGLDRVFSLAGFTEDDKQTMRYLWTLNGIVFSKNDYREWTETENLKSLNRLIHLGWVQEDREKDRLSLHPLVSEVVLRNLKPHPDMCPGIQRHLGDLRVRRSEGTWSLDPYFSLWIYSRWMIPEYDKAKTPCMRDITAKDFLYLFWQYYDLSADCIIEESLWDKDISFTPDLLFGPLLDWVRWRYYRFHFDYLAILAAYSVSLFEYEQAYTWDDFDAEFFALRRSMDKAAAEWIPYYEEWLHWNEDPAHIEQKHICDYVDIGFCLYNNTFVRPDTPAIHKLYCLKYEQLRHCLNTLLSGCSQPDREQLLALTREKMQKMITAFQEMGEDNLRNIWEWHLYYPDFSDQELLTYQPPAFPADFAWDGNK